MTDESHAEQLSITVVVTGKGAFEVDYSDDVDIELAKALRAFIANYEPDFPDYSVEIKVQGK